MNRDYAIGFCLGVLVVSTSLWGLSAWDDYQKEEQAKDTTHSQIMILNEQIQTMRFEMNGMKSDLSNLRYRVEANDNKVRDLTGLRPMLEAKIAELRHDLGL
jgi:ribosomal protein S15P/S13E